MSGYICSIASEVQWFSCCKSLGRLWLLSLPHKYTRIRLKRCKLHLNLINYLGSAADFPFCHSTIFKVIFIVLRPICPLRQSTTPPSILSKPCPCNILIYTRVIISHTSSILFTHLLLWFFVYAHEVLINLTWFCSYVYAVQPWRGNHIRMDDW